MFEYLINPVRIVFDENRQVKLFDEWLCHTFGVESWQMLVGVLVLAFVVIKAAEFLGTEKLTKKELLKNVLWMFSFLVLAVYGTQALAYLDALIKDSSVGFYGEKMCPSLGEWIEANVYGVLQVLFILAVIISAKLRYFAKTWMSHCDRLKETVCVAFLLNVIFATFFALVYTFSISDVLEWELIGKLMRGIIAVVLMIPAGILVLGYCLVVNFLFMIPLYFIDQGMSMLIMPGLYIYLFLFVIALNLGWCSIKTRSRFGNTCPC